MLFRHLIWFIFLTLTAAKALAQEAIEFQPSMWNFGSIREADGRVSHIFTGTNRTKAPLVILDVVTSCGCTAPEFSKKPILPGEKTQIKVTFDPTNRPGRFSKELAVYTSDRSKAATLTIQGNVLAREKSLEELYPIAGGGMRFAETMCAFSYIYIGRQVQATIGYTNATQQPLTLELRPQLQSGILQIDYPHRIAAGERGEINFAYLNTPENPHYGTLHDVFEVYVNGRKTGTTLSAHGIGVDNPQQNANAEAPKLDISENMLKFGVVKHNSPLQRLSFTLTNTGGGELIVRAVENDGHIATTLAPNLRIPAGESRRAEAMFDPHNEEYGTLVDHLVIVTNDPSRPMRRIRMTAIVEQ